MRIIQSLFLKSLEYCDFFRLLLEFTLTKTKATLKMADENYKSMMMQRVETVALLADSVLPVWGF